MKNKVEEKFSEFFERWVCELDVYLQQLHTLVSKENVCDQEVQANLLSNVTQHYKQYYTAKWALAHEDVLAFFTPIWITPLEKAYSWITGWKPSMMFKLVKTLAKETRVPISLTEEQVKKIEELRVRVRIEEEKVEREMERQQVALAERKIVEMARLASRARRNIDIDGDNIHVDQESLITVHQVDGLVLKGVIVGLEKVMKAADCVRLRTLKGILDVLSPLQSVSFLAEVIMLQIRLRQWGNKRMESSTTTNNKNIINHA